MDQYSFNITRGSRPEWVYVYIILQPCIHANVAMKLISTGNVILPVPLSVTSSNILYNSEF